MDFRFLLDLAIILISTKMLGVILKKIGLPQVLGAIIAGVILGITGIVKESVPLDVFSEIGVIMIMFTAGMETNFTELKKNGVASIVITTLGVIIPFALGFISALIIPDITLKERMFFGVILTATSVGITVATLKELNALHGKVGSSVITAAILDDIIGIIILAFFTANVSDSTVGGKIVTLFKGDITALSTLIVFINVIAFFIAAIAFGMVMHFLFKILSKKFPHTRRLPIFSLAMCFFYSWAAEKLFGIAAITGAFVAGMMIANMKQTEYVERRVEIGAYLMFSPIFFASIGIKLPYQQIAENFSWGLVGFSLLFVFMGIIGKVIGCGAGSLICKYKFQESLKIGVSMMVRGEVCLIVAQTGVNAGIMSQDYFISIVALIVVSSLLTPIILKVLFKRYPNVVEFEDHFKTPNISMEIEKQTVQEMIVKNPNVDSKVSSTVDSVDDEGNYED